MVLCGFVGALETRPFWVVWLSLLGAIWFLKTSLGFLEWVYVSFLRPSKNLKKKYGSWALVTGPTDGIGKAFAIKLARKGMNLVLLGRNPSKLDEVSSLILVKYREVQVKKIVVDFAGDLEVGIEKIDEETRGIDVGVLVNNVGVSYPYARFLHEVEEELLKRVIKVNVEGTTRVTHAVLPGMIKKKSGAIINIGSGVSAAIPSDPLYAVYSATKAYIDQFSKCIHVEYRQSGIDVQCQIPLYVATKMSSIKHPTFFIPSPTIYARSALQWIGYEARCTPYWPHSLVWYALSWFPESTMDAFRLKSSLEIRNKEMFKDSIKRNE